MSIKILGTYEDTVYFYDPEKKKRSEAKLTKARTFIHKGFTYKIKTEKEKREEERKKCQQTIF